MNRPDVEELSQALFEEAGDALFLFDPDSEQIIDANPMAQRLSGFSRSELLRQKATYIFRSETPGGLNRLRQAYRKTGIFHSQEGYILRTQRDGVWVPVNLTITRLHVQPRTLGLITARDVREQREAHEQLQKKDAELQRVMASISDCLWSAEIDVRGQWTYRYISPVVEKITGEPADFFLAGMNRWWGAILPEDRPRWEKTLLRMRGGRSSQEEYRILRGDGTVRWVRDSVMVSRVADGQALKLDGVVTDITEQKRAEDALRASEDRLARIVETNADGILIIDCDGRITQANAAAERILALPRAEITRRTYNDPAWRIATVDGRAIADPEYVVARVLRTGQPVYGTERLIGRAGQFPVIVSINAAPLRDSSGAVIGVVESISDITERKKAEEALRRSEERFRTLVEKSTDVITLVAPDGSIIYTSPSITQVLGYTTEERIGHDAFCDLHPDDAARTVELFQRCASEPSREVQAEFRIRHKDGHYLVLEGTAINRLDDPAVRAVVTTVRDITQRKRTDERLRFQASVLAQVRDAILVLDRDHHITYWNQGAERLYGYAAAEVFGRKMEDVIQYLWLRPGDEQEAVHALAAAGTWQGENMAFRKGGARIHVDSTVTVLKDAHGQPSGVLAVVHDVSERKQAEEALRQAELKYRSIFENAVEGIYQTTADGAYLTANPMMAHIYGFSSPHDLLTNAANTPNHFYADPNRRAEFVRRVQEQGSLTGFESQIRRQDDSVVWVSENARVVRDADGRILGYEGTVVDITERKRAEERLRETNERLRALIQASPLAILALDTAGNVRSWNAAASRMFGWANTEVLGKPSPLVPPERRADTETLRGRVLRGESFAGVETQRWRKDGSLVDVSISAAPLHDASGRVSGVMAVLTDITDRKAAEQALARERAILRGLIDSIPDLIFYKDRNGAYLGCNAAFEKYAGRAEKELVGLPDPELFPLEAARQYQVKDRQVLAEGKPRRDEEWIEYPDGHRVLVETLKTPFFGPDGQVLGLIGIGRDITERKRLEDQLRQAQKMEAIGQLAGGVAHDFNNLLTAILGNIGLLSQQFAGDGPVREMLQSTEKAAQRAAELTGQLLGFSRRTMLRLEVTNLNNAIQEIMGILRRTIDPRINVEIQTTPALWNVRADAGQLNQVLMNLCLNARDAMAQGGTLRLETANVMLDEEYARLHLESRAGEFIRLRVSDTGHGIPPEIRPRIFEPFFTTKQPGQGTGLGLAMVFGIVTQHQGWIECSSEMGHGTRFDIYLPRHGTDTAVVTALTAPPAPTGGTETILLVDDEPMIRNLGRTILHRYGYKVLLAEDGLEALEIYQRETERIDLVILDLTMPRLAGRDTLHHLLRLDPHVHVLFASGYSAEHVTETEKDGVLGFINKPYRPQELANTVRAVLDKCKTCPLP
ncbi:MAG: PAS domain S-box protein [Gemmataceae bacterium]|nr:PAS domain S-box protein [Gemmataceae bacterium]